MLEFSYNISLKSFRNLSNLFASIANKPVNISEIKRLEIPNLRFLEKCCMSGPTLQDRPIRDILLLKKMGIRTIVDFREGAPKEYADFCKNNGLSYFNFPLDSIENINNDIFYRRIEPQTYVAKPQLVDMLKKFFDTMKRGHAYVGCQYGIDRTNKGLAIDYFLGSNKRAPRMLHWEDETQKAVVNRNVRIVEKIFHHLTPEQKTLLGLPFVFRDILSRKMARFILENQP